MRRSLKKLEETIRISKTKKEKAIAFYNLGLFHDNNSREVLAIPNYEKALRFGLDQETKAKCLAWLASSLYKTGKPKEALLKVDKSLKISKEGKLIKFLKGLRRRLERIIR